MPLMQVCSSCLAHRLEECLLEITLFTHCLLLALSFADGLFCIIHDLQPLVANRRYHGAITGHTIERQLGWCRLLRLHDNLLKFKSCCNWKVVRGMFSIRHALCPC